jgi:hypothetical protein
MATRTAILQMNQRTGTAAEWTEANPTLLSGELGFESDTKLFKWGDGTTAWVDLAYPDIGAGGFSQYLLIGA